MTKKLLGLTLAALMLFTAVIGLAEQTATEAASTETTEEAVATPEKTLDEVLALVLSDGKTLAQWASEKGVLTQFTQGSFRTRLSIISTLVESGQLTDKDLADLTRALLEVNLGRGHMGMKAHRQAPGQIRGKGQTGRRSDLFKQGPAKGQQGVRGMQRDSLQRFGNKTVPGFVCPNPDCPFAVAPADATLPTTDAPVVDTAPAQPVTP